MPLNLPSNVTYQESTGLYVATNANGKTVRFGADSQDQLNKMASSVATGKPVTVEKTNADGVTKQVEFNPPAMVAAQDQVKTQQDLLSDGKYKARVIGNADGTFTDLNTRQQISKDEAQAKITAAGLPPETLSAISPKGSPSYAEATQTTSTVINTPASLPPAQAVEVSQGGSDGGTSTAGTPMVSDTTGAPVEQPFQVAYNQQTLAESNLENPAPGVVSEQPETTEPYVAAGDTGYRIPEYIEFLPDGTGADSQVYPGMRVEVTMPEGTENSAPDVLGAQTQGPKRQDSQFKAQKDWRLKLSLAPGANYFYKDPDLKPGDILAPLAATGGIVFPYTPIIATSYNANYEGTDLTHTNYKMYQYRNSNVGEITITADFTAQDTAEANYLLAVIHFFKTATKMFYGLDENPPRGLPPPLCYLSGYGQYQFDSHPLVIQSFNYTLPNDVDYIRAGSSVRMSGQNARSDEDKNPKAASPNWFSSLLRLGGSGLKPGAQHGLPQFTPSGVDEATYVPTKLTITITCLPMISRLAAATEFGLKQYATGALSRGSTRRSGGIW